MHVWPCDFSTRSATPVRKFKIYQSRFVLLASCSPFFCTWASISKKMQLYSHLGVSRPSWISPGSMPLLRKFLKNRRHNVVCILNMIEILINIIQFVSISLGFENSRNKCFIVNLQPGLNKAVQCPGSYEIVTFFLFWYEINFGIDIWQYLSRSIFNSPSKN